MDRSALLREMEAYFGSDVRRINHAKRVLYHAEKLMEVYAGCDRGVVTAAAILHDIGIHEAERKHGSSAGRFQEIEGPPIARRIMAKLGMGEDCIMEVCSIIAHHHSPGRIRTMNYSILYDADWLVNLGDEYPMDDKKELSKVIEKVFLTEAGKKIAGELYLKTGELSRRCTFARCMHIVDVHPVREKTGNGKPKT